MVLLLLGTESLNVTNDGGILKCKDNYQVSFVEIFLFYFLSYLMLSLSQIITRLSSSQGKLASLAKSLAKRKLWLKIMIGFTCF